MALIKLIKTSIKRCKPMNFSRVMGVVLIATASCSYADKLDVLNLSLIGSYKYDNNIFRLPDGVNPSAIVGTARSEVTFSKGLELNLDKPYSLQRFQLSMSYIINDAQKHSILNSDAKNYSGRWIWALTPYLTGNVFVSQNQSTSSFADVQSVSRQNQVTNKSQGFDADFSPYANWHILGGVTRTEYRTSNPQQISQNFAQQTSFEANSFQAGMRYVFPSGTNIALLTRKNIGTYINQRLDATSLSDTGYTEAEREIKGQWLITGKSSVTANLVNLKRESDNFSQRDYSQNYGGINYSWLPTAKITLNAGYNRAVNSFISTTASFSKVDTISISPNWAISPHLNMLLNAQKYRRTFGGTGPFISLQDRVDNGTYYGITLNWIPREFANISLGYLNDKRDSNVSGLNYSSDAVTLSGRFTF